MVIKTGGKELLTRKELEVVHHLHNGLLYKEIAVEMDIIIDTIKKHCKNIYKKLGVRNRTEAVNKVYRS